MRLDRRRRAARRRRPVLGAQSAPPQADRVRDDHRSGRLPRMFDPLQPMPTDADLVAMANEFVGTAIRRQTWMFTLDDDQRLGPLVSPIDGVPVDADPAHIARLAATLTRIVDEVAEAASVVLVWERPGSAAVRMQEADWIAGLAATDAPIRAQLLSSDDGVHLVDPAFAALVAS